MQPVVSTLTDSELLARVLCAGACVQLPGLQELHAGPATEERHCARSPPGALAEDTGRKTGEKGATKRGGHKIELCGDGVGGTRCGWGWGVVGSVG